jgi:acetyl esterase/lipase
MVDVVEYLPNQGCLMTATADLPRPPYDPELVGLLNEPAENLSPSLSLEMLREGWTDTPAEELLEGRAIRMTERRVPGPDGEASIVLAIFTATEQPVGSAPAIYHVHGGGMIVGDRFTTVDAFFDLIERHKVVVVSVEYRLAPEHPDPAPVEDCYAGLVWTVEHVQELGIDPDRLVIAGPSAGGGLTAGLALLARDRNEPQLVGQLLACPMLDDRNQTLSRRQYGNVDISEVIGIGWDALLGADHEGRDVSPYAAPGRVVDLSGLPPAFIDVGSAEPFRDEAVAYASRIWEAGGQAELHVWAGGFHGFQYDSDAAASVAARRAIDSWLQRILRL